MDSKPLEIIYAQKELLIWFSEFGRKFPWREKKATNFERIVSEVLLQRTKAESVSKFYPIFFEKYKTWKALGEATEADLTEILRPLGLYKQRANRLYKLAQEMKAKNGRFPQQRNIVEEMPMMGQYITNAYELFILKKTKPLIDVNMARVLERLFGKRKLADIRYDRELQTVAHEIVSHHEPIKINWAILDYAQLVCKSRNPICSNCKLNIFCNYYKKSANG